jgi:hypothetical protein
VNYDAAQRLREPAAWALIAAAGLQVLAGLIMLFTGQGFTAQAFVEVSFGGTITGVTLAGMVALAVLLVTRGESPSPQARTIVLAGLVVLGIAVAFTVIVWLASLGAGDETGAGAGIKAAAFLYGAAKLIVLILGAYFVYTVFQAMQPARPAAQPGAVPPGQEAYPGYGYPQQDQQHYEQHYGGGYPPQGYEQQQPQAYEQQAYEQQPYEQQQGYAQQYPQYSQQEYHQAQQQQPYAQPPQDYVQQPQADYQQQPPAEGEGDAGLWTRSYGSNDPQQPSGYPQTGEENDQNWYRDDRRSQ